jgi:uncharacterized membrane protein
MAERPRLAGAGYWLGFGLGGFFDGILLHQILQWHHLLSGIDQARGNLRLLVLTDGLFHLFMYVVCAVGLGLLLRSRRSFAEDGAGQRLVATLLIGFGSWHLVDALLSHWLLGLHRVRMDVGNPLVWDLAWLAVFGVVPVLAGWLLGRHRPRPRGPRMGRAIPVLIALCVVAAGLVAARPAQNSGPTTVVFRPGMSADAIFAAVEAVNGRFVWSDASGTLWAIDLPSGASSTALYGHGAWFVTNSIFPPGCLDWTKI